PNPPSPYLQSWNFTIERELGHGVAIETGYSASKGTHLGRKYDVNQQGRTRAGVARPFPVWNDIEYYTLSQNSSYQAGTVTLRRRFQHGLFFRANYPFGKSIDTASGLKYAGDDGNQSLGRALLPDRGEEPGAIPLGDVQYDESLQPEPARGEYR